MTDEGDILNLLQAHHANQSTAVLIPPEHHAVVDLVLQLFGRHVRLGPAIGRDDALVGLRAIVDDGPHQLEVARVTAADHGQCALMLYAVSIP